MLVLFEDLFDSGRGLLRRLHRRLRRAHATLDPRRGPTSTSRSEIADFAKYKREFFEKYIVLSNGLPTDDTLRRFFQDLNPKSFRARFAEWASSIGHDSAHGKVVSIDYGKKRVSLRRRMLRATHDRAYLESLLERL